MMQLKEIQEEQCWSSGVRFTGIRYRKWGRWGAEIRLSRSRRKIWLGSYDTPLEAAMAYDAALFCLRGPSSMFNFPDSCNRISSLISSLSCACSCMSADEIKSFSRQYALQQHGEPAKPLDETCSHDYETEAEAEAYAAGINVAAAVAVSPDLLDHQFWDFHEGVAWYEGQMHLGHYIQPSKHEHDTTDDDQRDDLYLIDSIWSD